jgi:hypothetical protein
MHSILEHDFGSLSAFVSKLDHCYAYALPAEQNRSIRLTRKQSSRELSRDTAKCPNSTQTFLLDQERIERTR